MFKGGRPKDPIWDSFLITADKAQCKMCLTLISKKALRMKTHLDKCTKPTGEVIMKFYNLVFFEDKIFQIILY